MKMSHFSKQSVKVKPCNLVSLGPVVPEITALSNSGEKNLSTNLCLLIMPLTLWLWGNGWFDAQSPFQDPAFTLYTSPELRIFRGVTKVNLEALVQTPLI